MAERPTKPTEVPPPQDPDRKRVLNVLAQRRYRQRQRTRMQELERKTAELSSRERQESRPRSEDHHGGSDPRDGRPAFGGPTRPSPPGYGHGGGGGGGEGGEGGGEGGPPTRLSAPAMQSIEHFQGIDMGTTNMIASNPWASEAHPSVVATGHSLVSNSWISRGPPGTKHQHHHHYHGSPSQSPGSELQDHLELGGQFQFPDAALLSSNLSELEGGGGGGGGRGGGIMRATYEIAELLGCKDSIWNLESLRTFTATTTTGGSPLRSFLPTAEQQHIPHHPVLDVIPWPAVRSKLIRVFNRSPEFRPPVARDPLALLRLVQDVADPAEGLRVNGPDGLEADHWEVGQRFFLSWWWALECSVIEKSSASRVSRGGENLTLP